MIRIKDIHILISQCFNASLYQSDFCNSFQEYEEIRQPGILVLRLSLWYILNSCHRKVSVDQSIDKFREEMSCFWNKSQKLSEVLREQIKEQKQSITEQLLLSFKECLNDKFLEEQKKISQWVNSVADKNEEKLVQLKKYLKDQVASFFETMKRKQVQLGEKSKQFGYVLKQKIEQTILSFDQFKMNFTQFKEEVFDNMVATQDHKQWLYQLDKKTKNIQASHNFSNLCSKGTLKVSSQYCFKQPFHLRYEQYISVAEKSASKSIKSEERTYLIDDQGFLLDSNRFYILDQGDSRIKVPKQIIEKLRDHGYMYLSNEKSQISRISFQA